MLAATAIVIVLAGAGYKLAQHNVSSGRPAPGPGTVADQVIYTARTANDAAITLPGVVRDELRQAGQNHQSIEVTKVDYTGNVAIVGQTWLVRHAAKSHNHAREARAEGHLREAGQGFRRRNRYLALTAVTAFAITSGMIWRGTAALGSASFGTTIVMVFVAAVTGLLLPTLAYLGIALDGSTVSRERDGLAADLEDDLDAYSEAISDSRRDLDDATEITGTLKNKTFPDICNTTQEAVDAVYRRYGTVRLLIGGLSADPPSRTTRTINRDAAGNVTGYIGTSIPGSGRVNLGPFFDRQRRLDEIETQQTSLLGRIDNLPAHPWSTSRT